MAIDSQREKLIRLGKAARLIPSSSGRPMHISSMYRFVQKGSRGVKLEVVKTPSGLTTSREEQWSAMSEASHRIAMRFDWNDSAAILERALLESLDC